MVCIKAAPCWPRHVYPIWHNPLMCGRYRLSRRKQLVEEYFGSLPGEEDWSTPLQHCPHPARPGHSPASKGASPGAFANPLGAHSIVGEGLLCRCPDDQRKVGNGSREACIPRCVEVSQVSGPGGRILRVAADEGRRSNRTALKSMKESCSHSQEYGIAGMTRAATWLKPARS